MTSDNKLTTPTPPTFFTDVRHILADARRRTYATVNFIMVEAYWRIGRRIVEEEQAGHHRAQYGSSLIRELSRQLGEEFGKGFSVANIENFRRFYLVFSTDANPYTVCRELTELDIKDENSANAKLYAVRRELPETKHQSASCSAQTRTTPSSITPSCRTANSSSPQNIASSYPAKKNSSPNWNAKISCESNDKIRSSRFGVFGRLTIPAKPRS